MGGIPYPPERARRGPEVVGEAEAVLTFWCWKIRTSDSAPSPGVNSVGRSSARPPGRGKGAEGAVWAGKGRKARS